MKAVSTAGTVGSTLRPRGFGVGVETSSVTLDCEPPTFNLIVGRGAGVELDEADGARAADGVGLEGGIAIAATGGCAEGGGG